MAVMAINETLGMMSIIAVFLALLVPNFTVSVRRLHDTDKSGWFLLLVLVPYIGPIILLILFCWPGSSGDNRFGPPHGKEEVKPAGTS